MRFKIQREDILKPLQFVNGVVEKRQTFPVLSNVLVNAKDESLTITATDLEIEIVATTEMDITEPGEATIPARKLLDICKALPNEAQVDISLEAEKNRIVIRSGKSRFSLSTLPTSDFPNIEDVNSSYRFKIPQQLLKTVIDKTQFSMALQDVRYYLNGLLIEIADGVVRAVATDGHRLSFCEVSADVSPSEVTRIIIPRKGVIELSKILDGSDETAAEVIIGSNHIRLCLPHLQFTSKLVDGQFPDYDRVIPSNGDKNVVAERNFFRQAMARAAILSNEKYRGIRLRLKQDLVLAQAHNPEMEEAEEEIAVEYQGPELELGFNVSYILDALAAVDTDQVKLVFGDANSSCLILPDDETVRCKYVVMPMRL